MRRTFAKLVNLVSPRRAEHDMTREIDAHLTLLQDEFEGQGMAPEDARRAARRAYGGVEQTKELHREGRSFVWVEQFFKDLRYAWSNLFHNPGFTLTAVLALALGIGVNATIFGIYNAVALKQLPVADPSSVMRVKRIFGENAYAYDYTFAYPEYQYLRDLNSVFSGVTAASPEISVLASFGSTTGNTAPEHLNGYAVSANYFADLGVNARIGRTFLPDEDRAPGANPVVVLSYRFWQGKLQGDPNAIGQTIRLNGLSYTIIGVAPQGFTGTDTAPTESGFWAPLSMLDQLQPDFGPASDSTWREQFRDSSHPGFQMLARLKDGVSRGKAQAETDLLIRQYVSGYRESQPTLSVTLQRTSYFGSSGDFAVKLFAAAMLMVVSLVLVVACANVANMLLARGVARQREIGIRLALGASRGRVIRQLLTESILLSLLGGAAGVFLSAAASRLLWASLVTIIPSFQQLAELDVSPDAHVLLYGLVLSVVTGILFGLTPALQSTRSGLYSATQAAGSRSRLRGLLLGIQVAVSVLLLVVSGGLLGGVMSSFAKASDLGYETRNTYLMRAYFGSDRDKASASMQRLRERLETVPEVSSASAGWAPLQGGFQFPMTAERWKGQTTTTWASDGYFETLGIPILAGRSFTRKEGDGDAQVAVISESTARRVWPGKNPLGKRFTLNLFNTLTDYQVVGVARDIRFTVLTEIDPLLVYLPTSPMSRFGRRALQFRIRGNRDKALVAVESAAESVVDPAALATVDLVSLEDGPVAIQRGFLRVLGAFAGTLTLLSLTLAGVGIYGVMAFLVSQRTREIGIRMALGATSRAVIRNVMLQGMWPVLIGTLVGIAGSLALQRAPVVQVARQFIQSPPALIDPVFYAELALVVAIALLASLVPARRALRVDPVVALRYE